MHTNFTQTSQIQYLELDVMHTFNFNYTAQ